MHVFAVCETEGVFCPRHYTGGPSIQQLRSMELISHQGLWPSEYSSEFVTPNNTEASTVDQPGPACCA